MVREGETTSATLSPSCSPAASCWLHACCMQGGAKQNGRWQGMKDRAAREERQRREAPPCRSTEEHYHVTALLQSRCLALLPGTPLPLPLAPSSDTSRRSRSRSRGSPPGAGWLGGGGGAAPPCAPAAGPPWPGGCDGARTCRAGKERAGRGRSSGRCSWAGDSKSAGRRARRPVHERASPCPAAHRRRHLEARVDGHLQRGKSRGRWRRGRAICAWRKWRGSGGRAAQRRCRCCCGAAAAAGGGAAQVGVAAVQRVGVELNGGIHGCKQGRRRGACSQGGRHVAAAARGGGGDSGGETGSGDCKHAAGSGCKHA